MKGVVTFYFYLYVAQNGKIIAPIEVEIFFNCSIRQLKKIAAESGNMDCRKSPSDSLLKIIGILFENSTKVNN
jgi:hypothetical protein